MPSKDIQKIRETRTKEDGDWGEWPYPTLEIESVVSGELRARILTKLGKETDGGEVRLIETNVSAGYSEYTQEDECSAEVRIGSETVWKAEYEHSIGAAMTSFLKVFA